jgi:hypothetical protein
MRYVSESRRLQVFSFAVFALVAAGVAWGLAGNPSAFNLVTVEQDVEIGKRSSAEVEKQLPMLHDNAAQRYVSTLGARLAAWAPGARFAYQFNVVDLPDINAFALPGGYIYVHRGLLERVRRGGARGRPRPRDRARRTPTADQPGIEGVPRPGGRWNSGGLPEPQDPEDG